MALSMDEQRILAEIEEGFARTEPALAARLSSFGRPGGTASRPARGLVMVSFAALIAMAFISVMLYALAPRRSAPAREVTPRPTSAPAIPALTQRGGPAGGPPASLATIVRAPASSLPEPTA